MSEDQNKMTDKRLEAQKHEPPRQFVLSGLGKIRTGIGNAVSWFWDLAFRRTFFFVILVLLFFYILPFPWLAQQVERLRDNSPMYNPNAEGAIVVDTPQLFTRERLINERLAENSWIDHQLEKVDDFLKNGQFARHDQLQLQETIRSLGVTSTGTSQTQDDQQSQKTGLALARELGLLSKAPIDQVTAAQTYRDKLQVRRYENILDDTHDLGENTLHRLNFNLHLSPARQRSDGLAVVTMIVREPQDTRLLFHHYGQLLVDTRQELEETVIDLTTDRNNVFPLGSRYPGLRSSEEEILDQMLAKFGKKLGMDETTRIEFLNGFLEHTVEAANEVLMSGARQIIVESVENMGYRTLVTELLSGTGTPAGTGAPVSSIFASAPAPAPPTPVSRFVEQAAANLLERCGQPVHLLNLAPEVFNSRSPSYQKALDIYIAEALAPRPQDSGTARPPDRGLGQTATQPQARSIVEQPEPSGITYTPQDVASKNPKNTVPLATNGQNAPPSLSDLTKRFDAPLRAQFLYDCQSTQNLQVAAKLRVLGLFAMLLSPDDFEADDTSAKTDLLKCTQHKRYPWDLGGVFADQISKSPNIPAETIDFQTSDDCKTAGQRWDALRIQLQGIGGEIGGVGLAFVIRDTLRTTPMDSSVRSRSLGDYFKFYIPATCGPRACHPRVSTYTEYRKTETNGQSALQPAQAQEFGRQEALRLYLELSCFAHVRSYTVWPRAGERQSVVSAESARRGLSGLFSNISNDVLAIGGTENVEDIRIRETDHIYGLTDWGDRKAYREGTEDVSCSHIISQILDGLEVDPEKLKDREALDLLAQAQEAIQNIDKGDLGAKGQDWINEILAIMAQKEPNCKDRLSKECITLDSLAWAAMQTRPLHSSFAWIVSPRNVSWTGVKAHVPMNVPLSAMISVPSWWGHLELEVDTCWVRPGDLRGSFLIENLCARDDGGDTDHARNILLPLPARAQDVLQRMGFFIIRAPYLDVRQESTEFVETGRRASVRLVGKRLWKNPRVRLGQQWHDEIEVLPNMGGVIAHFDCVESGIDQSKALTLFNADELLRFDELDANAAQEGADPTDGPSQTAWNGPERSKQASELSNKTRFEEFRRVEVWTSEGETQPTQIKVVPFRPRYFQGGEHERPCWLNRSRDLELAARRLGGNSN